MTDGERMVWAVAFAREYREAIRNPPGDVIRLDMSDRSKDHWKKWEQDQAVSASETAYAVISRLREIRPNIIEGFGEGEMLSMYNDITGKSDAIE